MAGREWLYWSAMRLKKALLGAAVALLGACGGKDGGQGPAGEKGADGAQGPTGEQGLPGMAGTAAATDGSRLKARWVTGSDGSKGFFGWLDSELGRPCSFQDTSAGLRCLPKTDAAMAVWAPYAGAHGVGFADAACSIPVAVFLVGDAPASGGLVWYALGATPGSVGETTSELADGLPIFSIDQGNCVQSVSSGLPQFEFWALSKITETLVSGVVAP